MPFAHLEHRAHEKCLQADGRRRISAHFANVTQTHALPSCDVDIEVDDAQQLTQPNDVYCV